MTGASDDRPVRVRFCPSPTGDMHVGNVRTALFNWAYARHTGGVFVFRIEDTDLLRSTEESYRRCLDDLRWLGLDWDEGPEVGGPYGPYRQSERFDTYRDVLARLLGAGLAYESFTTDDEVRARKLALGDKTPGYDNYDRDLTADQIAAHRAAGRAPVLRLRMPDEPITFTDLVRGEVTFEPQHVPDFVLARADGTPLYTLVNPVDDALMHVTHVLRGEDLLSSTPRQIALYRALGEIGVSDGSVPEFGHLPFVMGEGNAKLSKRNPAGSLNAYRERGFLPEALLNYMALLGWSIGEDREIFSMPEMVDAFDVRDVNANPARLDVRKCEAVNATWIRRLQPADLARRLLPYLAAAGLVGDPPSAEQLRLLQAASPLVQERMVVLTDAVNMLGFLFVGEDEFTVDAEALDKAASAAPEALPAATDALSGLSRWTAPDVEGALKRTLVDELGIKPRKAFAPVRVGVTGRTVSPPLYESIELLGRERTLGRLRAATSAARS